MNNNWTIEDLERQCDRRGLRSSKPKPTPLPTPLPAPPRLAGNRVKKDGGDYDYFMAVLTIVIAVSGVIIATAVLATK